MSDARLEQLSQDDCLRRLREGSVGRIAFIVDDNLIVLPVNYRFVEPDSGPLLAVRTRPGNVIDQASTQVAFEIDSIDPSNHQGWSVLVRGELLHAYPSSPMIREGFDSDSWLADRDAWLLIDPWAITGRELRAGESLWHVHPTEYL